MDPANETGAEGQVVRGGLVGRLNPPTQNGAVDPWPYLACATPRWQNSLNIEGLTRLLVTGFWPLERGWKAQKTLRWKVVQL